MGFIFWFYHEIVCFVHYIKQLYLVNLLLFEKSSQNDRFSQQVSCICFEFKKNDCIEYNDIVKDKYKQKEHKTKCLIKIDSY